jgi:Type II secretion system (T2SS), protein G
MPSKDAAATPRETTLNRMSFTAMRIQMFIGEHGRPPQSLSELPTLKDRDCCLMDAWNRPLEWSYDGTSEEFSISSLGRDGRPGGTGDDADMYGVYLLKADVHSSPRSSFEVYDAKPSQGAEKGTGAYTR